MEKLTVKQKKWDLSALYTSHKDDRFIKEMALVETLSAAFEEYRPLLTAEISSIQLIEILNKYEELIHIGIPFNSLYGIMVFRRHAK